MVTLTVFSIHEREDTADEESKKTYRRISSRLAEEMPQETQIEKLNMTISIIGVCLPSRKERFMVDKNYPFHNFVVDGLESSLHIPQTSARRTLAISDYLPRGVSWVPIDPRLETQARCIETLELLRTDYEAENEEHTSISC